MKENQESNGINGHFVAIIGSKNVVTGRVCVFVT